ncbi:MAG: ABC transporter permease [Bacteroidales bacterium]|nr:ABC transporter permease [Bacteroidales bacterium]
MILHSLKLTWNQRRKNAYLVVELFFLFIILMGSSLYLIDRYQVFTEGIGVESDQVFFISVGKKNNGEGDYKKELMKLRSQLKGLESVRNVSLATQGVPYVDSWSSSTVSSDSVQQVATIRSFDVNFSDVMNPQIVAGRWFTQEDVDSGINPLVIDLKLAEFFYESVDLAPGKKIDYNDKSWTVVGVIHHLKRGDFVERYPCIIMPSSIPIWENNFASAMFLIEVKNGEMPNPKLYSELVFNVLDPSEFNIYGASTMDSMKRMMNAEDNVQIRLVILVVLFLVVNLFLGMIGILGYNVKRRRSELGVRRAMGSTAGQLHKLLLFESFSLTIMALIPALILVIQIPLLDILPLETDLFFKALLVSIAMIFLLVTLSVYYPGRLATEVQPADALQEE